MTKNCLTCWPSFSTIQGLFCPESSMFVWPRGHRIRQPCSFFLVCICLARRVRLGQHLVPLCNKRHWKWLFTKLAFFFANFLFFFLKKYILPQNTLMVFQRNFRWIETNFVWHLPKTKLQIAAKWWEFSSNKPTFAELLWMCFVLESFLQMFCSYEGFVKIENCDCISDSAKVTSDALYVSGQEASCGPFVMHEWFLLWAVTSLSVTLSTGVWTVLLNWLWVLIFPQVNVQV